MVVVLALGALGVGYAAWSQTLNISATATVATFNVYMTNDTATKPADATDSTINVTVNSIDKASYNTSGNAGLDVVIANAAPGNYVIPNVVIHNDSSIPVDYTVSTVTGDGAGYVDLGGLATGSLLAAHSTGGNTITITIPNDATQGHTYAFTIPILVEQK